jgi:hypothetical protein
MPRHPEIPHSLRAGPFRREVALAAGLTPDQLRSTCWRRLSREVYCLASLALTDDLRLQAVLLAAPDRAMITGLTAAWLYGVWRPPVDQPVPMEFATCDSDGAYYDAGQRAPRRRLSKADITELRSVRITTPARTCFDLMRASTLVEAVVWADAFEHADLVGREELLQYSDERPRWPHVRKMRLATALSNPRAESPMESRLRMVIVSGGLPTPLVNMPIHDAAGLFKGRPDLHYLGPPIGMEYDGGYHLEPAQRAQDDQRENGLLVAGVPLLRYGAQAVYRTPERIVSDILAIRPDLGPVQPPDWATPGGVPALSRRR